MAKFTVAAPSGTVTAYEGDYKITDGGVLAIKPDAGPPLLFSPVGWLALQLEDAPQRPGDSDNLLHG